MSNQIVISSGAKVRSLEGVLTGTAGIVNSVPLGGANGVATLDSNGKVPLSQLPASVVTYLGTWNAATNTPTLANGTGDVGDLYICNVAGTVNFGAGPITFAVSDWVIYNGSEWQKSSGASGTVTSVAVTSTGNDAISITGSPITTAGTINIGFTGDNTQYVNGAGDLTTFPSLTGYVPYTGATTDVDLGVHVLNAQSLHVKGTAGAGHLGLKHQSAAATGSANESLIYANVDGDLAWQNDNLYLTTLSTHANTANRVYTFPDASGTIALTSNLSSYVPYTGATSNVDLGSHNLTTTGDLFVGSVTGGGIFAETNTGNEGYLFLKGNGTFGLLSIYNSIFANGYKYGFDVQGGTTGAAKRAYLDFGSLTNSTTRTYSFPDASGTLALTSDIPSLTGYVPYTGATSDVNLGYRGISASNINIDGYSFGDGGAINFKQFTSVSLAGTGYTSIGANSTNILTFGFNQGALNLKGFKLDVAGLTTNVWRTYTMPNADGTIALTSDIPSLANYVTLTGSQTITGIKTFTNEQLFGNGMTLTGGYITYTSGSFNLTLNTNLLTANRNVFLQDKAGTIALTSDLTGGTVTSVGLSSATSGVTIGSSPITTSGTITLAIATASGSQQGLLSSTDWTTFNNKQNALTNPVTGTGTSSYHAKFTGTSTIGNSMLTDDGTTLQSIGATRSNLYLKAASSSYYGQLAFTNGSNGNFGGISYNNSGQYMQFETNSSEWMRLTSDGKLGINTTTPTATRLSLGTGIGAKFMIYDNPSTGVYSGIGQDIAAGNSTDFFAHGYAGYGFLTFGKLATNGSTYTEWARIAPTGNFLVGQTSDNGSRIQGTTSMSGWGYRFFNSWSSSVELYLAHGGGYGMAIDSASNSASVYLMKVAGGDGTNRGTNEFFKIMGDGKINHVTSSQSYGGIQTGNATSGGEASMAFISGVSSFGGTPTSVNGDQYVWAVGLGVYGIGGNYFGFASKSDTWRVKLAYNGTSWTGNSDIRLKNIEGYIENAITKVNSLSAIYYNFKSEKNPKRRVGLIAQELLEVLPEVVDIPENEFNEDGEPNYLGVQYVEVVPLLVAAIKELSAKVTALENKIN